MGLFDKVFKSDKKKEKKDDAVPVEFKPIVITTEDVPKTLQEVALKYKISANLLDLRLLEYTTYIKMDVKEPDWIEVEGDDWEKFNKPEILLNPKFVIKQSYKIEIHQHKDEPWIEDLILHIAATKEKNRIICTIKSGSILHHVDNLSTKIKNLIHKKMIRSRILIGLWEMDFEKSLDEIFAKTKVGGEYIFPEDFSFVVASCLAARGSTHDALILHYKEKQKNPDESERVDHSKRGFIQAVEKGEVVIEYIKPIKGIPGRNCMGEFIPVEEPTENNKPNFSISENIEMEETDIHTVYRAKRGGYVVFNDNRYDIQDEMELEEVSFKKTGSIDAGVETEVKLHVNEKDVMKDAIGTGVEVEATEVKVEGNVGASAIVKAEEVYIGGQTHQNSKIFANNATVNVHRGYLKVTKKARITRLEGGFVEAKEVEISQMVGGKARGIEVLVNTLGANAKLYGVSRIEITEIVGENNKIVIDPSKIDAYHDEILSLEDEVEKVQEEIEKKLLQLQEKEELFQKSETAVQTLKRKILQDRERGIAPRPAFVAKIKQFQNLQGKISEEKESLHLLKTQLESLKNRLLAYQEMVVNAQIVNHGKWTDYTNIKFHLLYPQITLEYTPRPGQSNELIYLKKRDDESYEIAVKKVQE